MRGIKDDMPGVVRTGSAVMAMLAILTVIAWTASATGAGGKEKGKDKDKETGASLIVDAKFSGGWDREVVSPTIFNVITAGTGNDEGLGSFAVASFAVQEMLEPGTEPDGCDLGTSIGLEGEGAIAFPDGLVRLRRISNDACIMGTKAKVVEKWKIVGGTGRFEDAEGAITNNTDADLSTASFVAALTGTIKLDD